jgi:hypothetical protein
MLGLQQSSAWPSAESLPTTQCFKLTFKVVPAAVCKQKQAEKKQAASGTKQQRSFIRFEPATHTYSVADCRHNNQH